MTCTSATIALTEAMGALWAHLNRRSSADLFKVVDELGSSFSQVKMLFLLEDGGEHSVSRRSPPTSACHSPPPPGRSTGSSSVTSSPAASATADRRSRLIALATDGREVVERLARARLQTLETSRPSSHRMSGTASSPRCSPSSKGSPPRDPTPSPLRGEPPLVDAGGDVLRAVHGDARQHRRQRRAAVDPAQLRRLAVVAGVDDQRLLAVVRRAAGHRRPARRHLRPPQGLPDRRRRVRGRLGDDRLRARPRAGSSPRAPSRASAPR